MAVPLFDLKAQTSVLEPALKEAFDRVLRSGSYILGAETEAFEGECARYLGVSHALGVSSGTDAILLALMALEIGPGDEVICPSFTFFATAGCVARVGATPVFVDCCPDCFNISPLALRKAITPKTAAVIPVHLFGQSAELDQIIQLAREFDLWILEDVAQSFGAEYKETKTGALGDFGAYSFFPTKNLGAFGDAGLLATNNDELAERARILRVHGAKPKYVHHLVGGNFRIDALQSALMRVKLPQTDEYLRKRGANAAFYNRELLSVKGVARNQSGACSCDGYLPPPTKCRVMLPFERKNTPHTWNQYTIQVKNGERDKLRQHLQVRGIGSEVYYPIPLHEQTCFSNAIRSGELTASSQLAQEVLSLPIYPELNQDQLQEVVAGVKSFLEGNQS